MLIVAPAKALAQQDNEVVGQKSFSSWGAAKWRYNTAPAERIPTIIASMSVVAEVEAQWTAYLGETRTAQLREALTILREITDPYQATDWRSKRNRG